MSESRHPAQQETESGELRPEGALQRASEVRSWDEILAEPTEDNAAPPPSESELRRERGRARRAMWLKGALPVLVILLYGIFKWTGVMSERLPTGPGIVTQRTPPSLTGVLPAALRPLALNREQHEFVEILEALYAEGRWADLIVRVDRHPDEATRNHPLVEALRSLSEARLGMTSPDLEERLTQLEAVLRPAANQHPQLLYELRIARAQQIFARTTNLNSLNRNTDLILSLLGDTSSTPYDVDVRIDGARLYEEFGDALIEEGTGWVRGMVGTDTLKIRAGRSAYQAALRLIVSPRDWYRLEAISPRARADVERLAEKIRLANRTIHGPSLPLTASDSSTWDGRRGSPVHDYPPRGS